MIKAVTLDLWGTLFYDGPASDDSYKRQRLAAIETILKRVGVRVTPRGLERAYADLGRRLARIWSTDRDVSVRTHVTELLAALDSELPRRLAPDAMADLVHAYSSPALKTPPNVDDGAKAALEALTAWGLTLCVVSNIMRTPGVVLRKILDHHGLLTSLKVLTFSDECGIRKPDPEIFLLTLSEVGVSPQEAVHVGDDPVLDVQGAKRAGMRVIQLVTEACPTGQGEPDAVITGLSELPVALDKLGP